MLTNHPFRDEWFDRSDERQRAELDDMKLSALEADVGGRDVLAALDDQPLPDEPFNWTGITDDVAPRVLEVVDHVDRCCDVLLDVEYRTACRRLIHRAAVRDPKVFLRKGKTESAAAAIIWIIGTANDIFEGPDRILLSSRVVELLGLRSSASSRAEPFVRAAGFPCSYRSFHLDANFLVSTRRRSIIVERDRYRRSPSFFCPQCPFVRESDTDNVIPLR